jgi:mannosyltransferase
VNPITANRSSDTTAAEPAPQRRSRFAYLTWAAPAVVTAVLGLVGIGTPQLWRDEFATWTAATRSLPQLWGMLHTTDAVLGVYYLGLHFWIAVFGDSPAAMRLPSVIAMVVAAAVVGLIGKRLAGNVAGVASGLIFAFIPSVSRYAQEARPYAFATMFAALATLLFLRAMEKPSWGRWAWYALALAGVGVSNLIALSLVAGHLLILLWDFLQRTVRIGGEGTPETGRRLPGARLDAQGTPLLLLFRFCVAVVAGIILISPVLYEGHSEQASQIGGYPTPGVSDLIGVSGGLWQEMFSSVPAAGVIMLLAVLSLVAAIDGQRRMKALYALVFVIVPVVAVWVVSRGPFSYWMFRYMLFAVFGWALGAGLCVAYLTERIASSRLARLRLSPRFAVTAVLVAVVALVGVHDQLNVRSNESHNLWAYPEQPTNGTPTDYQAAAAVIAANEKPGDAIAFQDNDQNHYQVNTAMEYYLRGKLPTVVFQSLTEEQDNSLGPLQCSSQNHLDPLNCFVSGTPRIWVVWVDHLAPIPTVPATASSKLAAAVNAVPFSDSVLDYPEGSDLTVLGYHTQQMWQENGITVALLTV